MSPPAALRLKGGGAVKQMNYGDLTDKERVLIGLDIVPGGVTGKPPEEDRAT